MSDAEIQRRPGGRSARVRSAVLDATLDLLGSEGADAVTVGRVAALAGVHETSVYRRWGSSDNLIIDALLDRSEELLPIPDTGALRSDLLEFAASLRRYLLDHRSAALARVLMAGDPDPENAEPRRRFWETRYDLASVMVRRAVERGEIAATSDPALVLEAVVVPLQFRALVTGEPIGAAFAKSLVNLVLDGILSR